jgi:glutamate-1-semialdehyde 2,1-aminomutase
MTDTLLIYGLAGAAALLALAPLRRRIELSRAKHPSLSGHARLARRLAPLIPFYAYGEDRFFAVDGAPAAIAEARRAGFERLSRLFHERHARTLELTAQVEPGVSDLQFTSAYRVPFQFRERVGNSLPVGAFAASSDGVTLTDLDGFRAYDVFGSYGVNLFGNDFYKACLAEGARRAAALGPVLGPYHAALAYNVARLRAISGLDEVSFHMSGTEAVMQAVRLARYHTRRAKVVRFCGAYHGWWEDVQPGPGNPLPARDAYTLKDMDERSLTVLRRRRDIACVLVNPLQALHPNASSASDNTLVDGGRRAHFDRAAYGEWLRQLRAVCTERGIPLVFDEIFVGFRLAPGGAQAYFGVRADMVTYGKTLGGGLPVGVLCGRADLMRRFRPARPADLCFARGTFNSHPYVMAAMQVFLERLEAPETRVLYEGLDERWNARAARLNAALAEARAPVRVANLSSIFAVCYTQPSRYHWMLQYYLRAEGLWLGWTGAGRLVFSLDYGEAEFDQVVERFAGAARAMRADGWWWTDAALTDRTIRRGILREMISQRF